MGSRGSYKDDSAEAQGRKAYRSTPQAPRVTRKQNGPGRAQATTTEPAVDRFRRTDPYRARREWLRYEGTAQRDLFRELRERFLVRHASPSGWVIDVGSGPGRFLPFIGGAGTRRVALDVAREMLRFIPGAWTAVEGGDPSPDRVLGDAIRAPFAPRSFAEVALLGNTLGFAEERAPHLLEVAESLVRPDGRLLVEIAPAFGERSNYLYRLPERAAARLLRAPVPAVLARVDREGFRAEPPRRSLPGSFRRFTVPELSQRWRDWGWEVEEVVAVAPAHGLDPRRAATVRPDEKAWNHLLEIEEGTGRKPERWSGAASVLLSVRRPLSPSDAYD